MKIKQLGAFLLALALVVASCDPDTPTVNLPYENGVFITNEGAFSGGTGTVSFYGRSVGSLKNDIFAAENGGAAVGNILQSMTIVGDKAYLMVNNANKVLIINANTFKFQDSVRGLTLPRYLLDINGAKAYISEWGAGGVNGSIKVIDLNTKNIVKTIATGKGAGRMLRIGNAVWVVNDGGFDTDSTVAIIDISTETITSKIAVGTAPNSLVQDANGDIWVLAGGAWGAANGKLVQIRGTNVINTYLVPQGAGALTVNTAKTKLYFKTDNAIYQKELNTIPPSVWVDRPTTTANFGSLYGLGIDPKTDNLFVADAKNFASTGTVYIFNANKMLQDSLRTGIIPNGFCFQ